MSLPSLTPIFLFVCLENCVLKCCPCSQLKDLLPYGDLHLCCASQHPPFSLARTHVCSDPTTLSKTLQAEMRKADWHAQNMLTVPFPASKGVLEVERLQLGCSPFPPLQSSVSCLGHCAYLSVGCNGGSPSNYKDRN